MTAQSKATIKSYFETGDRPTQAQFVDFIDSYADIGSGLNALTGDVTITTPVSGSAIATISSAAVTTSKIEGLAVTTNKIDVNAVTNAKAAQMAAHTYKGNNTGSTANQADITSTQLTADLNAFVGDSGSGGTKGLVPAPATGDAALNNALLADGTWGKSGLVQQVIVSTNSIDSQTAVIPYDNTIPQSGEGTQLFSQSFTPKYSTSTIEIQWLVFGVTSGTEFMTALFKDAGANAINAAINQNAFATPPANNTGYYSEAAANTTARTYALRYGPGTAGTAYVNQGSGGALMGGVLRSYMIIREIKA